MLSSEKLAMKFSKEPRFLSELDYLSLAQSLQQPSIGGLVLIPFPFPILVLGFGVTSPTRSPAYGAIDVQQANDFALVAYAHLLYDHQNCLLQLRLVVHH